MKKFLRDNKGIIIFYAELVIIKLIVLNNLQEGIDKMKKNKEVMTRKSYRRKKEINKVWVKVKKVLIIFFIGFMCGLIYSNLFICSDLIAKAETNENKEVIQIDQEEEKSLKSQKNAELESLEKIEELSNECALDEVSCKIKKVAQDYGVDWKLAVAISMHETG